MRTRSSSNLVGESSPSPTTSNLKRRNRRHLKQPFILKESPVDTMADQRTMTELLRAPTEGYAEAIMVPPILAEHFELKHSLINMMTSDQFFGLEKDNPHDHIRWFNKITSTIKYKDAWDRYKDLIRACPHHGFTELHQLDTFYNALNPADQDSLNSAAGGNLLERRTQDVLTIIENKSKVRNSRNKLIVSQVKSSDVNSSSSSEIAKLTHTVNQQTSAVTTVMTAILKQFQATLPPASVKAVEEIYPQLTTIRVILVIILRVWLIKFDHRVLLNRMCKIIKTSLANLKDIIEETISIKIHLITPIQQNQVIPLSELEKIKKMNEINIKAMQTQIKNVKNELRNKMKTLIQALMSNQTNELKNMMSSFFQMNTASTSGSGPLPSNTIANPKGELKAIKTRSGLALDGPSFHMPPPFINPKGDERVEETLTDLELGEYTINVPPPLVQKAKPPSQRNYVVHQRDHNHLNIPYPLRMHKEKQQEKDKVPIHKFWYMFKQLHINITLADALILIIKYQKMLKALLSNKEKLLELATTPLNENFLAVILKKLPEKLGDLRKFLIPCGFSELKFKALSDLGASINLMPLSVWKKLGRPFLWTARALIDVHGEEMILHLFATNHLSGNLTFSSHTNLTSPEVINPLSSSTTSSSSNHLLKEFTDELALIIFPSGNDDLPFDIEFDLKELEYLLNHDPIKEIYSILEDSIDDCNLADPNHNLFDTILEMFTDEHTLNYSSPPLYDDFDDDLFELESDNDDAYDDPFDSKEDKIKESKLLIDKLDPPRSSDFLPSLEYDSFLFEDFFEIDALPSINNEDKVFNLGILIYENLSEVTIRVAPDKNVKKISNAYLILEDFDPPLYELPFHKEVSWSETLLSFSSKNEEKVFKPGILTSKGVHTSLLPKLSHQDFPTHARGFVLRSLDLHILSFILGIHYPILID
nr:hypothetical protein [Tanacetum cinerariifolium]